MPPRFIRSLLLSFFAPLYLTAINVHNYEIQNKIIAEHSLTSSTPLAVTRRPSMWSSSGDVSLSGGLLASQEAIDLSEIFGTHDASFNYTMARIKEFIKKHRRRKGKARKRAQLKPPKFAFATPFLYLQKDVSRSGEVKQFMDEKEDGGIEKDTIMGTASDMMNKHSSEMRTGETLTKRQNSVGSIEDLGARIEAEEAERIASDGDNPLKYIVKDGILYKKNKVPVARISLSTSTMHSIVAQDVTKRYTGLPLAQTMVKSSAVISETSQPLKYFDSAQPFKIKIGYKPDVPFSPPTMTLLHHPLAFSVWESPSTKWRGEGRDHRSSLISHTTSAGSVTNSTSNDLISVIRDPPPYPFSHCYMNIDGFMCCNRFLESLMRRSFQKLRRTHRFHECSVQKIATRIQHDSENVFNTTFETVVGIDDFAIRAHFAGDLMCKIQEGGRFIAAYATTMPSRLGVAPDPLNVVTSMELDMRDKEKPRSETDLKMREVIETTHDDAEHPLRIRGEEIPLHEKSREDIENDNIIKR